MNDKEQALENLGKKAYQRGRDDAFDGKPKMKADEMKHDIGHQFKAWGMWGQAEGNYKYYYGMGYKEAMADGAKGNKKVRFI